jgi:hypothetical protein
LFSVVDLENLMFIFDLSEKDEINQYGAIG